MCVDAPDTAPAMEQVRANQQIANRQLDMQERLIPWYQERQAQLDELTRTATNQQLGIMRESADMARDQFNYSRDTFRPLEQSIVAQVMRDSTPEAYERYASTAAARTGAAFATSQQAAERAARSMGVDPSSGRARGAGRAERMAAASAGGAAFNQAFDQAENRTYARRLDAAGLGRGLVGSATGAYSAASGAGSAAVGGANQTNNTAGATIGTGVQYGGLANGAMGNAGQALGTYYGAVNAANQASSSQLGSMAQMGMMAYMLSDEDAKEDKREMSDEEVMRGIRRTRVEKWRYKKGQGDGGIADRVGPYAHELAENFGVGTGTAIPVEAAGGIAMRGVQAIDKRLEKIERAVGVKRRKES